jgi:nucleoside-diphosphate-sugar epimerase
MIVFGPRSQYWTAQIAADLLSGKAYLIDGGSGICNSVYVDNLVHAMWLAAVNEKAAGQEFIITDGERVTWRDLYSAVAAAVGVDMASVPCIESAALASLRREQRDAPLKIASKRFAWAIRESLPPAVIGLARQVLPPGSIKVLGRWSASPLTRD